MTCRFLLSVLVNFHFFCFKKSLTSSVRNAGRPRRVVWHLDGSEESKNVTLERSQNYMVKPGTRSLGGIVSGLLTKKKKRGTF